MDDYYLRGEELTRIDGVRLTYLVVEKDGENSGFRRP
jgi:hypothetical protein